MKISKHASWKGTMRRTSLAFSAGVGTCKCVSISVFIIPFMKSLNNDFLTYGSLAREHCVILDPLCPQKHDLKVWMSHRWKLPFLYIMNKGTSNKTTLLPMQFQPPNLLALIQLQMDNKDLEMFNAITGCIRRSSVIFHHCHHSSLDFGIFRILNLIFECYSSAIFGVWAFWTI